MQTETTFIDTKRQIGRKSDKEARALFVQVESLRRSGTEISLACKQVGIGKDNYYKYKQRFGSIAAPKPAPTAKSASPAPTKNIAIIICTKEQISEVLSQLR